VLKTHIGTNSTQHRINFKENMILLFLFILGINAMSNEKKRVKEEAFFNIDRPVKNRRKKL
jgi:hypothetical protein